MYNDLAEASLLRLGTDNVGFLEFFYQGTEALVAGVVVHVVAPTGQDVVIVRGDDALELHPRRVRLWVR